MDGVLYCKPHFEQLFKETGSFTKKFQTCKINFAFNSYTIGIIYSPFIFQFEANNVLFSIMDNQLEGHKMIW